MKPKRTASGGTALLARKASWVPQVLRPTSFYRRDSVMSSGGFSRDSISRDSCIGSTNGKSGGSCDGGYMVAVVVVVVVVVIVVGRVVLGVGVGVGVGVAVAVVVGFMKLIRKRTEL